MTPTIECSRCRRVTSSLGRAPFPGPLGERIAECVCTDCWELWRETEVKVINELRLNFMDPEAQATLERHLREFLALPRNGEQDG